jgi:hypothetical protein
MEQIVNIVKKTTTYQRKAFQASTRDKPLKSDTSSMLAMDDSIAWRKSQLVKESFLPERIRVSRRMRHFLCCKMYDQDTEMHEMEEETKIDSIK